MKKIEKTLLILALVFAIMLLIKTVTARIKIKIYEQQQREIELTKQAEEERIELAKQDLESEYQWPVVVWLDVQKYENLEGRQDFYIFTCLTDEGTLTYNRFVVIITENQYGIDIDTWPAKERE